MSRSSLIKNIAAEVSVFRRGYQTFFRGNSFFCRRQMTLAISPVAAGTIKHRSAITLSPSGFIKNNGYREVF